MDTSTSSPDSVIARLVELQEEIGDITGKPISDNAFAQRYLPFSATSWSRLKAGNYGADVARLIAKAELAANEIPERVDAMRRAAGSSTDFVLTSLARAAISAVRAARDSVDRRIVPVVAPTGFGKTALARYYDARGAIVVSGRQPWRQSYRCFCRDVAGRCGPPLNIYASEGIAEAEMLRRLRVRGAGVLYIDEANSVGAAFANGLKTIHNETSMTIIVAAVPGPWDSFCARAAEEVRQVLNRCQPIIRASRLSDADVLPFLARSDYPRDILAPVLPRVRDLANTLGGVKTVIQVADEMRSLGDATAENADIAVNNIRRAIVASGIPL